MLIGIIAVDSLICGNGVVVNHVGKCLCFEEIVLKYLRMRGQINS